MDKLFMNKFIRRGAFFCALLAIDRSSRANMGCGAYQPTAAATAVRLLGRNFGTEVERYTAGRKPYPQEIFTFIKELFPDNVAVLDLGCGNGRGTLRLYEAGFTDIVGYDIDDVMLAEAKKRAVAHGHFINFINDRVTNLPSHFSQKPYSLITAFAAFHWFCSPEEIAAIRSVLSPQGVFVVVAGSENNINTLDAACQKLMEKELGRSVIKIRNKGKKLAEVLKAHQFKIIQIKDFATEETYTCQQFEDMLRSQSSWTELSAQEKERIWPVLKKFIESELNNGKSLTVHTVQHCIVAQKA